MRIITLFLIFLVTGCATKSVFDEIDFDSFGISKAEISDITIEEVNKPKNGISKLKVKANYKIENFHEIKGFYDCAVLFDTVIEKQSVTAWPGDRYGEPSPCILDEPEGIIDVVWSTPVDRYVEYSKHTLIDLSWPIKYDLVIKQRVSPKVTQVIGKSEKFILNKYKAFKRTP